MDNSLFAPPTASEMKMGNQAQANLFAPPTKEEMAMGDPQSSGESKSWLDTNVLGYTPRGVIQGGLNMLPTAGMVAGSVAGGALATPETLGAGTVPGAIAGAGLGAAAGESLKNMGEKYILGQDKTYSDVYGNPIRGAVEGMGAEMGGQIIGKGIDAAANSPAGQYVIGKLGKVPAWAAGKVGKIFADVPEETTARYLANPEAINSAPSREAISDQIVNLKGQAEDKLAQATEELSSLKAAAKDGIQNAQQLLGDKKQAFKEALQSKNLTNMAGEVTDAISELKDKVIQGSNDSYKILENADGDISTAPLVKVLQNHIDSNMVRGVAPTKSAQQAIDEIKAMQSRLLQMGDSISMPEAKQILQSLDTSVQYSNKVGSFAPEADQAFSSLRHAIDQDVKSQVPEYAAKMQEVARQSRLLKATSDLYGTPAAAINNLNRIGSQSGQAVHLPLLDALGSETGKDLTSPVNDFLSSQKVLKTPSLFDKMIDELPESKQLASTQKDFASKVDTAEAALEKAKGEANIFKGISPQNVTAKTKALGGANNYGAEATLTPIDERFGTNLQDQIRARNDLDQFSKESTHGSRKAIIGGGVGAAVGGAIAGKEGALIGASVGSQVGGAADKYGGQLFKYGLDKMASGAQTGADIIRMTPPAAPGQVVNRLYPVTNLPKSADQRNPEKGPDRWANDGFQNLKGHATEEQKKFLDDNKGALMVDPKARNLLITASSFSPGAKPLDDIMKHLKNRIKQ